MTKLKTIKVQWMDASSIAGWRTLDSLPKLSLVNTIGFLSKETKEYIVVCATHSPADADADKDDIDLYGDCIAIPKAWIKSRKAI